MSNVTAYFLLGLLVIVLFFLLKPLSPMVKGLIGKMPQKFYFLLIAVVLVLMFYLVGVIASPSGQFGAEGTQKEEVPEGVEEKKEEIPANTIIIRNEEVYIGDTLTDMAGLQNYLKQCALEMIKVTILDDYSMSKTYHRVVDMCQKAGVNYIEGQ